MSKIGVFGGVLSGLSANRSIGLAVGEGDRKKTLDENVQSALGRRAGPQEVREVREVTKGLLSGVALVALLVGAGAVKQGVRVAEREVAFGRLSCSSIQSIGQITGTLSVNGTAGIVGTSAPLELKQIFDVAGDTAAACEGMVSDIVGSLQGVGCATGPVRLIGNVADVSFACQNYRNDVNIVIGQISGRMLESDF